jgi:hypothetical protein
MQANPNLKIGTSSDYPPLSLFRAIIMPIYNSYPEWLSFAGQTCSQAGRAFPLLREGCLLMWKFFRSLRIYPHSLLFFLFALSEKTCSLAVYLG